MNVTQAYVRGSRYFRDDLGKIILSTVLIGLTTLAELLQPFPFQVMLDRVFGNEHPSGGCRGISTVFGKASPPPAGCSKSSLLAATVLVLRFFQESLGLVNGILKIKIGYNGLLHVRTDLFRKLEELSLSFHRSRAQGDTIYRLGSDTTAFQAAFNVVQTIVVNLLKSSRSAF